MSVTVRHARVEDLPWLIRQLKAFAVYYETTFSLFPDDAYARAGITNMIENHLVLVAEKSGGVGPIGLMAGIVQPHFYNPKIRVLAEMWWWVPPEHRETRAGALLLKEFLAWGKKNAEWITMCLTSKTPIKESQLTKRGFREQERCFLMEVA